MATFIDLFSGAGLFSAGFMSAGFRPLLAVDTDSLAVESYRRNVAAVAIVASVEQVVKDFQADLIIAGPPCQGFSTLGPCDPSDDRNRLCLSVSRWAAAAGAAVVVVENVPPFVGSSQWRRMTAALRRLGYEVEVWCLDAADYGTPQHRVRSFTIASKIGIPTPPSPSQLVAARIVFRAIQPGDAMHIWPEPSAIASARIARVPLCGDWRDVVLTAPELCPPSWFRLGCQATDVWGRIDPARPANTLKSRFQNPSTGRYLHPTEDRVVSLREGARLQGVSDNWILVGHREAMVRQIGNGVPVPLAHAVARQVAAIFQRPLSQSRSAA